MISTVLATTLHSTSRAVIYSRTLDAQTKDKKKHKLRIEIVSDTYLSQSHARLHRWNGEEWKLVVNIPPALMKTPAGLVYQPAEKKANGETFMEDVKELHRLAGLILE